MRFGVVTDVQNRTLLETLGFDYLECCVTAIAGMDDAAFAALAEENDTAAVKIEAACVLLPGSIRVTGAEVDPEAQAAYLERAFARLERLGVGPVVFGSGGARRVPDGFDRAEAWHQLIQFGRLAAEKAVQHGLTIVLEPLRKEETNIINTQMQGLRLMQDIERPGFDILSDFYHLSLAGEGRAEVAACGKRLKHTHIANPDGRVAMKHSDAADYDAFFAGLSDCGYHGRMSIEGSLGDYRETLPEALALIREKAAAFGL